MNALDAITVVLDRPQNPLNVGAVVRALKNMGIGGLRLVAPGPLDRETILRVAHHAEEMVDSIETYADLDAALADAIYVVGTAAVKHPEYARAHDLRPLAAELIARTADGRVALLFGTEDDGLDRRALDRCYLVATLPSAPDYPALNLAQSVLLFAYELRLAVIGDRLPQPHAPKPARQEDLERLFLLSEEALNAIGFFKHNPGAAMRTLRQVVYRAGPTNEEVALLMAIARQIRRRAVTQSEETTHLLSTAANAERLEAALAEIETEIARRTRG